MVEEGDRAPDFTLSADDGSEVTLKDLRGQKVILYFYPKDFTSGCTTEACDFRDLEPDIRARGAVVVGVSPDPVERHARFVEKHDLNFRLLADEDHEVADAYGVWQEKKMAGRTYMGIVRSTFLIDEEGRIRKAWRNVRAKGHAARVEEALG